MSTTSPFVVVTTTLTVEQAAVALEVAIGTHGFGLLSRHDLGDTLRSDRSLTMALPCRIAVYTEAGQTKIGMISPIAMLASLSTEPRLAAVAAQVEATTRAIIDAAAHA